MTKGTAAQLALAAAAALLPGAAHAEPAPSCAYLPLLWGVALAGAAVAAALPLLVMRLVRPRRYAWAFRVAALLLGLLFLLLAGPIVVAVGSLFLTGRTM